MGQGKLWSFGKAADGFRFGNFCVRSDLGAKAIDETRGYENVQKLPVCY